MRREVCRLVCLILALLVVGLLLTATGALASGVSDDRLYFEPRLSTVPEPELPEPEPPPAPRRGWSAPSLTLPSPSGSWVVVAGLALIGILLIPLGYFALTDPIWPTIGDWFRDWRNRRRWPKDPKDVPAFGLSSVSLQAPVAAPSSLGRLSAGQVSPTAPAQPPLPSVSLTEQIYLAEVADVALFFGVTPEALTSRLTRAEIQFVWDYMAEHGDLTCELPDSPQNYPADYPQVLALRYKANGWSMDPAERDSLRQRTGQAISDSDLDWWLQVRVLPVDQEAACDTGYLTRQLGFYGDQREVPPISGRHLASMAIGFTPIFGSVHDAVSFITGKDYIADEDLDNWERVLTLMGLIPGVPGAGLRRGVKQRRLLSRAEVERLLPGAPALQINWLMTLQSYASKRINRGATAKIRALREAGGAPQWLEQVLLSLTPEQRAQIFKQGGRYPQHLLGALAEVRAEQLLRQRGHMVLKNNGFTTQQGIDIIYLHEVDGKTRVVFLEVKASAYGRTISDVPTLRETDRLRLNQTRAEDAINEARKRGDLSQTEAEQLIEAVRKGDFDVQVALMGGAEQSTKLGGKLPGTLLPPLQLD